MNLPLVFRRWEGDEWPEKRISIADYEGHALFINARYVPIEAAQKYAEKIVRAVNSHDALVEALGEIVGKLAEQNMDFGTFFGPSCHKAVCALAAAKGEDND